MKRFQSPLTWAFSAGPLLSLLACLNPGSQLPHRTVKPVPETHTLQISLSAPDNEDILQDPAVEWATVQAFYNGYEKESLTLSRGEGFQGEFTVSDEGEWRFVAQAGEGQPHVDPTLLYEGQHTVAVDGDAAFTIALSRITNTTYTEDAPTNYKYMTKDVVVTTEESTTLQTHRFNFDAPDEYNGDKTKAYPLVISLHAWGPPNSEQALAIPQGTSFHLADNSPYATMPGPNPPPAFHYAPICPPPYLLKDENGQLIEPNAPNGGEWNSPAAKQMIVATVIDLISRFHIDTRRIYLNGFSMGGAGTWYIAQALYEGLGYPVAAIVRGAGYTPTETMIDENVLPDVYRSAIWIHVGENDTMSLHWNTLGNYLLAVHTYQYLKDQLPGGSETTTNRTVGDGLTSQDDDGLTSTLKDYTVDGRSRYRLSVYPGRDHEVLWQRNTDIMTWMYSQTR